MHSAPPEYWWAIGIGTLGLLLLTGAFLTTLVLSQKRLRSQLSETQRNEAKYRDLFDNSLVGMFRLSLADLIIVDANKTFLRLFGGRSVEDVSGVFFPIAPHLRSALAAGSQRNGFLENEEIEMHNSGGGKLWISMSCRTRAAEGYAEGIVVDITKRKMAEGRLRDSHQQLRNLSARLETVREEERVRIARQVHDDLGQVLTAVKMQLTVLAEGPNGQAGRTRHGIQKKLESLTTVIDRAIDLVRNISADLRPLALQELGLKEAIEWEASQISRRSGIHCEVKTVGGEAPLAEAQATAIFRIFQEAITNVVRHASAHQVAIRLASENGLLILEIADNGRGIMEEQVRDARALGILGMKERATFLGGTLDVMRNNGGGTLVSLKIPLEKVTEPGVPA
jgi:PAS domain S-box-containing protein